jgi:hypothetical protein
MTKEEKEKSGILQRFMIEHFPFTPLRKSGFFTPNMKGDYEAQAARVCQFFGYKTVFEYGDNEVSCHLSKVNPDPEEPFITTVPNIYD